MVTEPKRHRKILCHLSKLLWREWFILMLFRVTSPLYHVVMSSLKRGWFRTKHRLHELKQWMNHNKKTKLYNIYQKSVIMSSNPKLPTGN